MISPLQIDPPALHHRIRMISAVLKAGLRASLAAKPTQTQAKRFLYPRIKTMIVRRKGDNEVGIAEKCMYAAIFFCVMYSYPFYIMAHLPDYRGETRKE